MGSDFGSKISGIVKEFALHGKAAAIAETQRQLIPHIIDIFANHDQDTVWQFIVTDYPLVEEETPQTLKNTLANLANNSKLRGVYHNAMLEYITPENILMWLRNPEEWLDDAEAQEQRERLRQCAEVIETTEGGYAWLEEQVLQIYRYADIVPEDSTPANTNERA